MSVITVAFRVAKTVLRFSKRATDRGTKYNPSMRFAELFPPNYRPYVRDIVRGADIALSGGLIAEIIGTDLDGISQKQKYYKKRQARDNFQQSRYTGRYSSNYSTSRRRPTCKQEPRYRSRYR